MIDNKSDVFERQSANPMAASLTQRAYDRLREALLACHFEPGEPLRIGDLGRRLDASQGAVREALSRLTSEGLVEARPQRGFRVTPIAIDDLRDLTTARIDVEQLCLRRAIGSADVRWESRIVAAFHHLSHTPPLEAGTQRRFDRRFVVLHQEFFDVLVSNCESVWLKRVREMLQIQALRYQGRSPPSNPAERDLVGELRALMDAAIARDAETACQLLGEHMRLNAELLVQQIAVHPTAD